MVSGLYLIIYLSNKAVVNDWLRYDLMENLAVYFFWLKENLFYETSNPVKVLAEGARGQEI
jgi:hypothetical protein